MPCHASICVANSIERVFSRTTIQIYCTHAVCGSGVHCPLIRVDSSASSALFQLWWLCYVAKKWQKVRPITANFRGLPLFVACDAYILCRFSGVVGVELAVLEIALSAERLS